MSRDALFLVASQFFLACSFVAEAAIEGFDERVIGQLSRTREVHDDTLLIRPSIQRNRCEFAAIVGLDTRRRTALPTQLLDHCNDRLAKVAIRRSHSTARIVHDSGCKS